jgi:predicted DNA-binding transcriptional regulator YafY
LLEATVFWSGEVSTNTLIQHFGISRVQASKDLTLYQTLCQTLYPGNIRYDKSLKRYVIDETFMAGSAAKFLQILKICQDGRANALVALTDNLPAVEVLEPAFRQVDPAVLRTVNRAIVSAKAVRIRYQSMSHSEPAEHRLCPHALVFDGLRWYTRAFSHIHGEFRDFVLARILSAEFADFAEVEASEDKAWQTSVPVKIASHPGLSDAQKKRSSLIME